VWTHKDTKFALQPWGAPDQSQCSKPTAPQLVTWYDDPDCA
jgi:hypothetical protein